MTVRVLGCSGSIAAGDRTTAFLVGDDILVDAGTGVGDLHLHELVLIDHIVLSHSHLDHIVAIPLLADSVMRQRLASGRGPIVVHGLEPSLRALKTHIFNNVIWPDFTVLPSPERPILRLQAFETGQTLDLNGRRIEVLPAVHTVPAVGFAVWPQRAGDCACWVYTGDTAANPALWVRLNQLDIRQLVIETAFSDQEKTIADRSGHLHPAHLVRELARLHRPTEIYITHIKPGEQSAVMGEIAKHGLPHRLSALITGQVLPLDIPTSKPALAG